MTVLLLAVKTVVALVEVNSVLVIAIVDPYIIKLNAMARTVDGSSCSTEELLT